MEKLELLISENEIQNKILEIANQINKDLKEEPLIVICILKGSSLFTCDLIKRLTMPVILDFMIVSSYEDKTESSGTVKIIKDLDNSITNKNVLIVEDIIDTGRTLSHLVETLSTRHPKNIKLCTLLDKPDRRVVDITPDYTCFTIPNAFIVGYGLDYIQKYRNIPYIAKLTL